MTQDEAYDFCYEHQNDEDDYEIVIHVFENDDEDNDGDLLVVCNDIYHYMDREDFEELKEALETAAEDFDITIIEED